MRVDRPPQHPSCQPFEWGQHYRPARRAGVARETIIAIRTRDPTSDLDGPVSVVVRAADEVVDDGRLSQRTLADLEMLFPDEGLRDEFLYLVAGYRMFATVSASRPTSDTASGPWPPDGVAPPA